MRAASVTKAEVAGGHFKRFSGENVTRPGARSAREFNEFNSGAATHQFLGARDERIYGRTGGVVTAGDVDFEVAKTALREMGLQSFGSFRRFHVGDEAQIHFCHCAAWQNRFAAGTGVACDETFNVDRRARTEKLKRFLKTHIVKPVLDAE